MANECAAEPAAGIPFPSTTCRVCAAQCSRLKHGKREEQGVGARTGGGDGKGRPMPGGGGKGPRRGEEEAWGSQCVGRGAQL